MNPKTAFVKLWDHPSRNYWAWLFFALAAAAYYHFRFQNHPSGLPLYQHAAECVWNQQILQVCELAFTYPPAFAFLMIPFVAMPLWIAPFVWYVITLACAIICCWACENLTIRTFPGPWPLVEREWLRFFAILIGLKFILAVFEDQAYDLLVLPLTLVGILALTDRRDFRRDFHRDFLAAVSFAAAAALKVTPLIFLPYLLFKRRFAAAAIFVIVFAGLSFLPDLFFHPEGAAHGYFLTWVREVAAPGLFEDTSAAKLAFWSGANPLNLSLRGAVALAVDQTPYQADFLFWLRIVQCAFIAVIAGLLLISSRVKLIPVEGALLIISMLMLSPMTGRGHFVGLLLPYYLIVGGVMNDKRTAWLGIASLAISFFLSGIPREIVHPAFSEFMRMHSDIVYATLILIVYFAVIIILSARRSASTAPA